MASEENAEGRKTMIMFVVVLLLSCIVVTVIYNLVKSKFIETGFLTAYITIGIFTTVVTALAVGLILGLMDSEIAWEGQEIMALIVLSLFGSVLPSTMAAGISVRI